MSSSAIYTCTDNCRADSSESRPDNYLVVNKGNLELKSSKNYASLYCFHQPPRNGD
jgi:hypothetical protein